MGYKTKEIIKESIRLLFRLPVAIPICLIFFIVGGIVIIVQKPICWIWHWDARTSRRTWNALKEIFGDFFMISKFREIIEVQHHPWNGD